MLVIAEILKLVFIERLFSVSRTKLLSIPAFAWATGNIRAAKKWLMSTRGLAVSHCAGAGSRDARQSG